MIEQVWPIFVKSSEQMCVGCLKVLLSLLQDKRGLNRLMLSDDLS